MLNASNPGINSDEWDIKAATESLMQHVADTVQDNPRFKKYADHWRKRGKTIDCMLDLLRCYYADIAVVRIPEKGRYMLTNTQVHKLHQKIEVYCDSSFNAKADAHMLSNVEELETYLQAGFDHFTSKKDEPFNFVDVALRNNPIPRDFGDHIVALAAKVRTVTNKVTNGPGLFRDLSSIVASCIFIDCIRASRPGKHRRGSDIGQSTLTNNIGKAADLFDKFYASSCLAALEHFCDKHWPCEYSKRGSACVNVRSSHDAKGHQDKFGKVMSLKPYESSFAATDYSTQWRRLIKFRLQEIEAEYQNRRNAIAPRREHPSTIFDRGLAYELHGKRVSEFFRWCKGFFAKDFTSQTTCYCCLMEVPMHPLQCGHVLCGGCIKAYGQQHDSHTIFMPSCPIHPADLWDKPNVIHFKPDYAGVRVLTLDG